MRFKKGSDWGSGFFGHFYWEKERTGKHKVTFQISKQGFWCSFILGEHFGVASSGNYISWNLKSCQCWSQHPWVILVFKISENVSVGAKGLWNKWKRAKVLHKNYFSPVLQRSFLNYSTKCIASDDPVCETTDELKFRLQWISIRSASEFVQHRKSEAVRGKTCGLWKSTPVCLLYVFLEESCSEQSTQFDDKKVSMRNTSVCQKKLQRTNWQVLLENKKPYVVKSLQPNEGRAGPSSAKLEQGLYWRSGPWQPATGGAVC